MKEISPERKILGMQLLNLLYVFTEERNYYNAFTFEKEFVHNGPSKYKNKKFNSQGDYEFVKFSYVKSALSGFFSSVLDEETKEIKEFALDLVLLVTLRFPNLLERSLSYLLEVLNDEQESVRVRTAEVLTELVPLKIHKFKDLQTVYAAIKEDSVALRERIYFLMGNVKLESINDFKMHLNCLIENLRLFSSAFEHIFLAVKESTRVNCQLLDEPFFHKLFGIDLDYLTAPADYLDLIYVAKFVALDEALSTGLVAPVRVPSWMKEHRVYFCNKYPFFFRKVVFDKYKSCELSQEKEITKTLNKLGLSSTNVNFRFLEPKENYIYKKKNTGVRFPFYLTVKVKIEGFDKEEYKLFEEKLIESFYVEVQGRKVLVAPEDLTVSSAK